MESWHITGTRSGHSPRSAGRAAIDAAIRELDGKTLTRPVLMVADVNSELTYCVDVDIGQKMLDRNSGDEVLAILKNVAIASGDQSLLYAETGAAVRLRRTDSGRWEVSGFSKVLPGSYTRTPITIGEAGADVIPYELGETVDITNSSRLLTYDELATIGGGYGICPYGAIGIFRGPLLIEVHQ